MIGKTELRELVGLLEERLRVIGDGELRDRDPEAQLASLREVSEAIMAFHVAHRAEVPPRLNHFLENCSFEKAREWAEGELAKG
ncbi:MAG: hypothetical protein ABL994_15030 [Verrucomicrobiales bacterium]